MKKNACIYSIHLATISLRLVDLLYSGLLKNQNTHPLHELAITKKKKKSFLEMNLYYSNIYLSLYVKALNYRGYQRLFQTRCKRLVFWVCVTSVLLLFDVSEILTFGECFNPLIFVLQRKSIPLKKRNIFIAYISWNIFRNIFIISLYIF